VLCCDLCSVCCVLVLCFVLCFVLGPLRSQIVTTGPKLRSNLRGVVSTFDLRGPQ